jgi:hypothetical protein
MNEHGSSSVVLSSVILDRIGGLEKVISNTNIEAALEASSKFDYRTCWLNHKVMMWVVLAMGLFTDLPIRQVFKACRRIREGDQLPGRSALCLARQRLGSQPLIELFRMVVRPLANHQTPWAFYKGMRKVGIDGSIYDVPDCEAHQHLGRATGSRGEGPFPQVRKLSLVELGTHVELALTYGGWQDSERALLPALVDSIPDDALVMLDAGFYSYEVWKSLHFKHQLLIRVQKSMVFEPIQVFEDGSYLAKVYRSNWYRENDSGGILVRVIEYTLDDPQRTGHQEKHVLLTNLLEDKFFPAQELICEYHERWEEELMYDEQKTHQDPVRAEKVANFRSETTDGLKQEIYALSLAHFVTRLLMFQAATARGIDVDRLSFKGCFQIIKTRLPEFHPSEGIKRMNEWFKAVIWEMGQETIPLRRNRVNPRVIKRKMSRWDKKQPEHRKIPPLKKRFEDCIVMLR